VGKISVAKSGGTKENSSNVAFHRTPRVLAVLSESIRESLLSEDDPFGYELILLCGWRSIFLIESYKLL